MLIKKMLIASLPMLILSACSPNKNSESTKDASQPKEQTQLKEYEYVESVKVYGGIYEKSKIVEKEPRKIMASSDTAAFAIGFRDFLIQQLTYDYASINNSSTLDEPRPESFKIYDNFGNDVTLSCIPKNEKDLKVFENRMDRIKDEVVSSIELLYSKSSKK